MPHDEDRQRAKVFSLTGWKVGRACASPPIAAAIAKAHSFLTFTTSHNLQRAMAYGLSKDDRYFAPMREGFAARVETIPVSSFYAEDPVTSVVRLCFSKNDSTLDAGIERLARALKLFR